MRQTLKKREILRGYGAFNDVLSRGRVYSGKKLKMFVVCSPAGEKGERRPAIGFGVARKVGSAVARNRLKRLMREIVRRNKIFFTERCSEASVSRLLLMCSPHTTRSEGNVRTSYLELEHEFRKLMDKISHR